MFADLIPANHSVLLNLIMLRVEFSRNWFIYPQVSLAVSHRLSANPISLNHPVSETSRSYQPIEKMRQELIHVFQNYLVVRYRLLADLIPANHPVLSNTITLGVDPDNALNDIIFARNMSNGKAANMWPQDMHGLKLTLEKFAPLRIEWELSSIGGRSDDQVCESVGG